MNNHKKIAALQINSSHDVEQNLAAIETLLADAQQQQVDLVLIPEMFATLDGKQYSALSHNAGVYQRIANWGKQFNLWLIAGAFPMPCPA